MKPFQPSLLRMQDVPLEKPLKKAIPRGGTSRFQQLGKRVEFTSPSSRCFLAGHDHKKIYAAMSQAGKDGNAECQG